MLTEERHAEILARLQAKGRVLAADLSADLGCSPDTIRRDLRELDDAGLLRRVHGGALPRHPDAGPFTARARRAGAAKATIAHRAAARIADGQVVLLDGGTTTLEVARALRADLSATIVTTSPPIAVALAERPRLEVVVVGGVLHPRAQVALGAGTVAALRAIRPDVTLLGVCGLHPEIGITADDPHEREAKAAMIDGAAEVVALADADKLGTELPFVVAPIGRLTHLVTDAAAGDRALEPYRAAGIEVVRA